MKKIFSGSERFSSMLRSRDSKGFMLRVNCEKSLTQEKK